MLFMISLLSSWVRLCSVLMEDVVELGMLMWKLFLIVKISLVSVSELML